MICVLDMTDPLDRAARFSFFVPRRRRQCSTQLPSAPPALPFRAISRAPGSEGRARLGGIRDVGAAPAPRAIQAGALDGAHMVRESLGSIVRICVMGSPRNNEIFQPRRSRVYRLQEPSGHPSRWALGPLIFLARLNYRGWWSSSRVSGAVASFFFFPTPGSRWE